VKKIVNILSAIKREFFPPKKTAEELEIIRLQKLSRYTETTTNLLGNIMYVPDAASFLFIYDELFKKQIYKFSSNKTEIVIVDCGANIGLSIIYFKKLFPNAKIIAFEPDNKIFEILKKNIQSFNLLNVELHQKACWNAETTLPFYQEGADGGRHASDVVKENIIFVETVRLKNYLNRDIDFLKIDIEGAEFEVLNDSIDMLHNVKNIFIEFHSFVGQEQKLPEILNVLKIAGFRLHISAPGLVSTSPLFELQQYAGMDNQINIYGFR
jgi:FkbM family methyltransferase